MSLLSLFCVRDTQGGRRPSRRDERDGANLEQPGRRSRRRPAPLYQCLWVTKCADPAGRANPRARRSPDIQPESMRRLSNVKGIHGALSEGRFQAPPLVDSTGSGPSNNLAMVQLSKLNSSLGKPGALSHYANVIKGRGQQRGATVQIVQAELTVGDQHEVFFVAGINSSARQGFTSAQLELLRLWDVRVAPCIAGDEEGPARGREHWRLPARHRRARRSLEPGCCRPALRYEARFSRLRLPGVPALHRACRRHDRASPPSASLVCARRQRRRWLRR